MKMSCGSFFLTLCLCLVGLTTAQEPIGCFVSGECFNSAFLDISYAYTPELCLQFCKETDGCFYFTHYQDDSECIAFVNCEEFDNESCGDDCTSGDVNCQVSEDSCIQPGRCIGTIIEDGVIHDIESQEECTQRCREADSCQWASFDLDFDSQGESYCTLTSDCDDLFTDCVGCTHAPAACQYDGPTFLLVVGGQNTSSDFVDSTEVLDFASGDGCICGGAPYPLEDNMFAVAMVTPEGFPIVCGGEVAADECLILDLDQDTWVQGPNMIQSRRNHFAVRLANDSYWILGGGAETTTEFYTDGQFLEGPDLLENVDWPCAVALDSENVFVSGGRNASEGAEDLDLNYIMNVFTGEFDLLGDHRYDRSGHACGVTTEADRAYSTLWVVGGIRSDSPDDDQDLFEQAEYVELRSDPENLFWNEDVYPRSTLHAASVPFGDSFMVVGGSSGDGALVYDSFFQHFDGEFVERQDIRMSQPRFGFAGATLWDRERFC